MSCQRSVDWAGDSERSIVEDSNELTGPESSTGVVGCRQLGETLRVELVWMLQEFCQLLQLTPSRFAERLTAPAILGRVNSSIRIGQWCDQCPLGQAWSGGQRVGSYGIRDASG